MHERAPWLGCANEKPLSAQRSEPCAHQQHNNDRNHPALPPLTHTRIANNGERYHRHAYGTLSIIRASSARV